MLENGLNLYMLLIWYIAWLGRGDLLEKDLGTAAGAS